MFNLETTDKNLVGIAIGEESNGWYVQTTDIKHDTYLSENIADCLRKDEAFEIANKFRERYGMKIVIWSNERVYVEGYGYGIIQGRSSDMTSDYPIFIEFEDESLHELDRCGYFSFDQIKFDI